MSNEYLILERQDAIARITLSESAVGMDLSGGIWGALRSALLTVEADNRARAILITGATGAFASETGQEGNLSAETCGPGFQGMLSTLVASRVPVVVALRGKVMGGAAMMALCGDWIIVDDSVEFFAFDQVLDNAVSLNVGSVFLSAVSVAPRSAGAPVVVGGREAANMGFVTECVQKGVAQQRAEDVVRRLARGPTRALVLTRQLVDESAGAGFEAQCRRELEVNQVLRTSYDCKEGVQAFLEKRAPRFRGN